MKNASWTETSSPPAAPTTSPRSCTPSSSSSAVKNRLERKANRSHRDGSWKRSPLRRGDELSGYLARELRSFHQLLDQNARFPNRVDSRESRRHQLTTRSRRGRPQEFRQG